MENGTIYHVKIYLKDSNLYILYTLEIFFSIKIVISLIYNYY